MKHHILKKQPRVRRQAIFEAYSIDEAYSVLLAYRDGEIGVSPFARQAPERQQDAFPIGEALFDAIIQSVALIGYQVISTYCNGETPSNGRVHVCETALRLAKLLASRGILQEYGQGGGDIIIGGYSFPCRLYYAPCTGVFLVPKQPGKKVRGYFGSFPRWALRSDTWPVDEALAKEIILYGARLCNS